MAQQERRRGEELQRGRQQTGGAPSTALQRGDGDGPRGLSTRRDSPVERMISEVDWMFDEMQRRLFGAPLVDASQSRLPQIEIEDTGNEVVLTAEIPGVDPANVQLQCSDDVLTIRAEEHEEEGGEQEGARARRYARFFAQVALPPDVDIERAQASVDNGVLTIRLPKAAEQQSVRQIPISTEQQRAA
jgi:HSP20 family protein